MGEFYKFGQQLREVLSGLLEVGTEQKMPTPITPDGLLHCKPKETPERDGSITTTCEEPETCPKLLDKDGAVEKECRLATAVLVDDGKTVFTLEGCFCIYKPKGAKCKLEDDKCNGDCPPLKDEQGNDYEGFCYKAFMPEAKDKIRTQCICVYQRKSK